MATDGDECDPSMGDIVTIDLTEDTDEPIIDPQVYSRTDFTKPTPEQVFFRSPSELHKI